MDTRQEFIPCNALGSSAKVGVIKCIVSDIVMRS